MYSVLGAKVWRYHSLMLMVAVVLLVSLLLGLLIAPNFFALFVFVGLVFSVFYTRLYHQAQQLRQNAERAANYVARSQIITEALSNVLSIPQAAEVIMAHGLTALGASAGSILLLTADATALEVVKAVGYPPEGLRVGQCLPLSTLLPITDAVRTEQPVWFNSWEARTGHYPSLSSDGAPGAWTAIPLIVNGQVVGGLEFGFSEGQEVSTEDKAFINLLARKCALAMDRARLYGAQHVARAEAARIQKRAAFLAQINTVLASGAGYASQLESVARVVVSDLADWCAIDILEKNGSIRPVAAATKDLTKQALLADLRSRYLPTLNSPQSLAEVLRTGASKLYPELTDEMLVMTARDDQHLALIRELGRTSMIIAPLVARGRILGAITLVSADSGPRFTADDLALAEELGRRAGLAADNAQLYDEVQAQRARLQVTLASIGDAVITTDTQGRITFMNGVAETLTGWRFDETAETYLQDVFRIINETTRQPQEDPVAKVIRKNTVVGLANHTILIAKDGTEIPIDDSGAPIRDENGTIIGVILVFRDILERRQKETALDATLQRTQDLYETCRRIGLVSNPDEVVQALLTSRYLSHATQCAILTFNTLWNDERPERFEVAAVAAANRPLPGFAPNGSLNSSLLAHLLSRDGSVYVEDTRTDKRLNQETRELFAQTGVCSTTIFPLTAGRRCFGTLVLYFASPQHWSREDYRHIQVFVDQICVTMDNVRLFAAEARARQEAEQANQVKLKFLAMISHELRTPLTSIKGFASTLLATDVTWDAESQRDFATIISDEADKLTELIGQLLDLSRLQAGKLRIQPESRTLSEIVGTAMAELQSIVAQHRLVIDIPPGLPPVFVDTQRIAEVLVNLVGNAVKYAPSATPITISATAREADLQVNVGDEGPGIPLENRERVFEAFLQLENSPLQQGKGLGLGLAICRGLIEAHGGKIWVADTRCGTTMSFTLPLAMSQ